VFCKVYISTKTISLGCIVAELRTIINWRINKITCGISLSVLSATLHKGHMWVMLPVDLLPQKYTEMNVWSQRIQTEQKPCSRYYRFNK